MANQVIGKAKSKPDHAGIEDPAVAMHVGFEPAPNVESALDVARDIHGPNPSVAVVPYPAAISRA